MKISLSILARNIHNAAQIIAEAYLRRSVIRQGPNLLAKPNHRRFSSFQPFRSSSSNVKSRR
jgi:replicative DNA helicase